MTVFSSEMAAPGQKPGAPVRYVVGNWKVRTKSNQQAVSLVNKLIKGLSLSPVLPETEIVLCPSFTQLQEVHEILHCSYLDHVVLGAQDCSLPKGATGDIPAGLLASIGVKYVILGHSERRMIHGESSAEVQSKVRMASEAGLVPIVCVGETLEEHHNNQLKDALLREITESIPKDFSGIIAYEPIWAVGAAEMASIAQIEKSLEMIREILRDHLISSLTMPLLYGGAIMTEAQSASVFKARLDGVLVGRASLSAKDFMNIIRGSRVLDE